MPAAISLNGVDYAVVPRDVRIGGKSVQRDVEEYTLEQFGIVTRATGIQGPEQITTYRDVIFPNLMLGLGRDRIDSDSHNNPDEYRRFWYSNGVDTRWGRSISLPILEEDSTYTDLEVIRASAHYKNNLWAQWEDDSGRTVLSRKYDATEWIAGGSVVTTPVFDASSSGSTSSGTSVTIAHTVANQPNRGFIVSVSTGGAYPSGITYAGTAMTRISQINNTGNYVSIWSLANPSAGTNNIIVSLASSDHIIAGGMSFYHVNQSSVLSNAGTNGNSGATSSSITVTTTANDFAVDAISINNGSPSLTVGSGQAERFNVTAGDTGGGSTERATGTSTVMSWSWTPTVAVAHVAARVNGLPVVPLDVMAHKTHLIALMAEADSHAIYRSTDGATWTVATTQLTQDLLANSVSQSEDIDAGLLAEIGSEAVAIIWDEDSGTITFFSSTDAGNTWADEAIDIPSGNGPQGVAVYPDIDGTDKLYVSTREGLWMVDTAPSTWTTRLVLPLAVHGDHGRRMAVHQNKLWFGIGVDDDSPAPIYTMEVTGDSRVFDTRMGLNMGDGVEAESLGPIRWMKSDGLFLYASAGGGAGSRNAQIICHNGKGWHTVRRNGTANQKIQWIDLSSDDDGTPRLHYSIRTATSVSALRFLAYPSTNPNSGVSIKRETSGFVDLPYLDLGMPLDTKNWLRVGINAEDLSATNSNEYVNVDYGILSSGALQARSNTDLGDFLSGTSTIPFVTGTGVESRVLGLRINLHRDGTAPADTPKIYDIQVAGLANVNRLRGFTMTIDLMASAALERTKAELGGGRVEQIRSDLEAARDLGTNMAFIWGPSGTINVRVKSLRFFDELRSRSGIGFIAPDSHALRGGFAELTVEEPI